MASDDNCGCARGSQKGKEAMRVPKNLRDAIQAGVEENVQLLSANTRPVMKAADVIEKHVRFFLRSKFRDLIEQLDDVQDMNALNKVLKTAEMLGILE